MSPQLQVSVCTCRPHPGSRFRYESAQSSACCEGDQSADQVWLSEHLARPSMLPPETLGPTHLETHRDRLSENQIQVRPLITCSD